MWFHIESEVSEDRRKPSKNTLKPDGVHNNQNTNSMHLLDAKKETLFSQLIDMDVLTDYRR